MTSWEMLKPEEAKKLHLDNNASRIPEPSPAWARRPGAARQAAAYPALPPIHRAPSL